MDKRLIPWIRKNLKKIAGYGAGGAMALVLAGCATTPITAPTSSSAKAPTAQKDAVVAWASGCQAYDQAKVAATTDIADKKIPTKDFSKIDTLVASGDQVCSKFPTDPTTAATDIASITASIYEVIR